MAHNFETLWSAYSEATEQHRTSKQACLATLSPLIDSLCRLLHWHQHLISLSFDGKRFIDLSKALEKPLSESIKPSSQGVWVLWIGFELAPLRSFYPLNPAPVILAVPLFFSIVGDQLQFVLKTDSLGEKAFEFNRLTEEGVTGMAEFIGEALSVALSEAVWQVREQKQTKPIKLWIPPAAANETEADT